MSAVSAIDVKTGNLIRFDGSLFRVFKTEHVKPGKGGAFVQAELKNIKTGTKLNKRFRSDEVLEKVLFESKEAQLLSNERSNLDFMDPVTYDQFTLPLSLFSGPEEFLIEGEMLMIDYADDEAVAITLPQKIKVKVNEAEPYLSNQTKKSSFKTATLTNGVKIQVPEFIADGDEIIITTDTLEYVEKAK